MDFYHIKERSTRNGVIEVYPDFKVGRSKDLMVRGKSFYAIWDEEKGLWSTDEYDVQRLVDKDLYSYRDKVKERTDGAVHVKLLGDFSSRSWSEFQSYMNHISDNARQLDTELAFSNTEVKKEDYISKRLPYPLEEGDISAYDEMIGTLYDPEERAKLEWAIGSIIAGDSKDIQKFIVLYGDAGAGKSTILNIIQKLFEGYYTTFEAKALTSSSNAFSTEVFKENPLVAIQHDGDLSKIEDNTKLNSIVSHEEMTMNEKYKPSYTARINSFLFMATNRPVKITDAKSGIIRRLIDVTPSGRRLAPQRYQALYSQIDFELGAIAHHCLNVYREMGKNYYNSYRPMSMIFQTDVFFNFVESNFHVFKEQDGATLTQAYDMYKAYCDDSALDFRLPRYKFREELKNYFDIFHDITRVDGKQVRSYYEGFQSDKFTNVRDEEEEEEHQLPIVLDKTESILDDIYKDQPAQLANHFETPSRKWSEVTTTLSDIDTSKIHYVKLPLNHIVIDFDITNDKGEKDLELNLKAASKWPPTYTELSKGGQGLHLHYYYDGDAEQLSRVYDDEIEIKVFTGNSSLRRRVSSCNDVEIGTISSGLPLKGEKMINTEAVKDENHLRSLIEKNLRKEIHPHTKPSVDFIHAILEDAFASDMKYDIRDMRPRILAFANTSTNQAATCVRTVSKMKFKSEDYIPGVEHGEDKPLAFFDVEVFPNLFVVVWKTPEGSCVKMINPEPSEVQELFDLRLVGYNCRRYDNHILYARYLGYNNEQLYQLSQKIINNSQNATFGQAYNLSYLDVYEMSSKKQSLKKFQVELGINHAEWHLPWTEPVDEELWERVADYCCNDVEATQAVFEAREADYKARLILAELSGLTVNDTTQRHTAQIIFGNEWNPQSRFEYTDLSEMFPGYTFERGVSQYRGEDPKEGGYVYAEPGMYENVALLDIASMHPTSAINMNVFGPYTKNYKELMDARLAIKHNDISKAKKMLDGKLEPYLDNEEQMNDLSNALKIVINIVYGLTSAKFPNKFKDPRNVDNIVAKRGSLFMIDLKHAVQEKGYTVAHIKTDSIKIPNADDEIIEFVTEFGKKYGYDFEHELTFDKMCLVNDAVYVGKVGWAEKEHLIGKWDAVGTQYQEPYTYKTLFSKEPIGLSDMTEVKSVTTALYLDFNEDLPEGEHDRYFIGQVGAFTPVRAGVGGGQLMREKDGDFHAATGTKGYRWLETSHLKEKENPEELVDKDYYNTKVDKAVDALAKHGDVEKFLEWKEGE